MATFKLDLIFTALLVGALIALFFAGMYIGVTLFSTPYNIELKAGIARFSLYAMLGGTALMLVALPPAFRIIKSGKAREYVLLNRDRRAGKPS